MCTSSVHVTPRYTLSQLYDIKNEEKNQLGENQKRKTQN